MALRDKLVQRIQPHLEPGEQVQAVFLCQTGPSPYFSFLSALIVLFGAKYYVVAATDRAYVVCRAGSLVPSTIKGFDRRLPRNQQVGPLTGLWGKSQLLGASTHIHRRFFGDVERADAGAAHAIGYGVVAPPSGPAPAATPPAGWYPDPEGRGGQRYFDGAAWTDHRA